MTEPVGPLASTGYWLKLAALAWQRELEAELRPLGLTSAQFSVLAGVSWLNREAGPPTQQQVADFAGADRMMTSKILHRLQGRGLVRRSGDPADARVWRLELTASGRTLVTRSTEIARAVDRRLFGADVSLRNRLMRQFDTAERHDMGGNVTGWNGTSGVPTSSSPGGTRSTRPARR